MKEAIESEMGSSRKGRNKIIRLVQKKYPQLSASKIRMVYGKEGYPLTRKYRKRVKKHPANPIQAPLERNQEWAVDVLQDVRQFRIFNAIDQFNRQAIGILPAFSIPARKVTAFLNLLIERYGKPAAIRSDNGPEFTSKWFQLWLDNNKIQWSPIQKGWPQQNALIERFISTYREAVLDAHLSYSIDLASDITEAWLEEYNNEREHEALGYQTPVSYAA